MPKQSPVPDELSKPFWDACNQERLIVQNCAACTERRAGVNAMQHPPEKTCQRCGSGEHLEWRQVSGRGTIYSYGVMYDSRIKVLQAGQPFNIALIQLEEDAGVLFYSHLPGTPVDQVPVGARVQVEFETTPGTGQKVPEWRVVSEPKQPARQPAQRRRSR